MVNETLLPEILKHRPLREDVQAIDHVSYMLSNASVELLDRVLNEMGVVHQLRYDSGNLANCGITIAYSKNRISIWPFKDIDYEMPKVFVAMQNPISINLNPENIQFKTVTEPDGKMVDVLLINNKDITDAHQKFINDFSAEWSEGEYYPYIRINNPSYYHDSDWFKQLSFQQNQTESIVFDKVRYMRFGVYKKETT